MSYAAILYGGLRQVFSDADRNESTFTRIIRVIQLFHTLYLKAWEKLVIQQ